ncbi:hypothetical protein MN608_07159 [Microdochium nivale]|nr:hypothetical protein MN608_07159 [Microdochium nivale]
MDSDASSNSSRGNSPQPPVATTHSYPSPHSATGKASVTHRNTLSVWNHGARIREKDAPTPKYDDAKFYR